MRTNKQTETTTKTKRGANVTQKRARSGAGQGDGRLIDRMQTELHKLTPGDQRAVLAMTKILFAHRLDGSDMASVLAMLSTEIRGGAFADFETLALMLDSLAIGIRNMGEGGARA